MPDTDLEHDLARARTALLDAIQQPPLDRIAGRATTLRRRRLALRGGTALATVVAIGITLLRPWAGPEATVPPAETPPSWPVYTADGITINGLTEAVPQVPDLPGAIGDVEFADADHGYLITSERAFASTEDGGFTWQRHALPADARGTELYLFSGGQIGLLDGYVSADGGKTWQRQAANGAQPVAAAGKDELLRPVGNGELDVFSPEYGVRGYLADAPPITVSWVATRPTADGIWWVGGTTNDGTNKPALASSRDGGHSWQRVVLNAPSGQPQVSFLGSHAYAVVLGADRAILAILHSADGGKNFTPTRTGGSAEPTTLAGEAVPLLDGRLLVTTTTHMWYVSDDNGATFKRANGNLPFAVGALRRTWAGYVAYDLFGADAGWAAFSSDGSTWRKLHIR
jgi:Photosynthesis system II assembly factor YCF48